MKTFSKAEGEQSAQILSLFCFYDRSMVILRQYENPSQCFSLNEFYYSNDALLVTSVLWISVSLKCIKHGFVYENYSMQTLLGVLFQKWGTSLPHPFSRPCPGLTANGLSKWPIAESLCNCVIRFHTFQSSNPVRMCRCARRSLRSGVYLRTQDKSEQPKNRFMYFMSVHVWATRVEVVLNEMCPHSLSVELDVRISEDSHVCVYWGRHGEDGGVSL